MKLAGAVVLSSLVIGAWAPRVAQATCGDGAPDSGEQCDNGAANGTVNSCCDVNCMFKGFATPCADTTPTDCFEARCDGFGTCNQTLAAKVPGAACGSQTATDCDDPDTCDFSGMCQANLKAFAVRCTDTSPDDCFEARCDGFGTCNQTLAQRAPGLGCGDPTATDCNGADTCDFAGVCQPNLASPGASCGDQTASQCTSPDTCDGAGVCQPNHAAAGATCGAGPTACSAQDTCDGAGTCLPNDAPAGTSCQPAAAGAVCNGIGSCVELTPAMPLYGLGELAVVLAFLAWRRPRPRR